MSLVMLGLVIAIAIAIAIAILLAMSLPRSPSAEERTRATSLARQDRVFIDELTTAVLTEMGVTLESVIYDHATAGCYTNQMVPTGSRSEYSKRLAIADADRGEALRRAWIYFGKVNEERFGGKGTMSDEADIAGSRKEAHLYAPDGFTISVSDAGVDGFLIEASGPCRTG